MLRGLVNQLALPVQVPEAEILRKRSLGAAITLCYELAGMVPKQVTDEGHFDKAQLSRWEAGTEGVLWPKLDALMDVCGNDAPVLWMLHQRGYDLGTVRPRESELQRQLRLVTEENTALKRVLLGGGR